MTTTKIRYELREYHTPDRYGIRYTSDSESDAKLHALNIQDSLDIEYKIVAVIVTETVLDIFTVPAYVPPALSLEELADEMSSVYAGSVDYDNEQYVKLSKADQQIVQDLMNVDDCEICGWTFQSDYLSSGDHGLVCDRCESDAEDEEQDDE
jgi:hypothetical protein